MNKFATLGTRKDSGFGLPLTYCTLLIIIIALLCGAIAPVAEAQTYTQSTGLPTFSTSLPIEDGSINLANGQIHLELPLASYPQRGGGQDSVTFTYDSGIWSPASGSWQPVNVTDPFTVWGGWRFRSTGDEGQITYATTNQICSTDQKIEQTTWSPWYWRDGHGTLHTFPTVQLSQGYTTACGTGTTSGLTSDGFASDGSGFHLYVNNNVAGYHSVYGPDGTMVYRYDSNGVSIMWDRNGNQYNDNLLTDTVGRFLPRG